MKNDQHVETSVASNRMNKPGVLLIGMYYGRCYPSTLTPFLLSCASNTQWDWLIVSNLAVPSALPGNVRWLVKSVEEMTRHVRERLGVDFDCSNGYRLCDLRPSFGELFADEIGDHAFWGHCDFDMMFGRLGHFLGDKLAAVDRLQMFGHLSIFRNIAAMNGAFRHFPQWRNTLGAEVHQCFDETPRWYDIYRSLGLRVSSTLCFADIDKYSIGLRLAPKYKRPATREIFEWRDGAVRRHSFGLGVKVGTVEEFAYVHFAKRSGICFAGTGQSRALYLLPGRIVDQAEIGGFVVAAGLNGPVHSVDRAVAVCRRLKKRVVARLGRLGST